MDVNRTFKVFSADEINKGVYEVVTNDCVFSYIVNSEVEPKYGDIITVHFQLVGSFISKIIRNGDVFYVHS